MMNELTIYTKESALVFFKENSLDKILDGIEDHANNFVGDTSTKKGRDQIISKAASVSKIKIVIDNAGKSLNEERAKLTKAVNADRNKATKRLEELRDKIRKPVTEWEVEEDKKLAAKRLQIEIDLDREEAEREYDLFKREKILAEKERVQQEEEAERQRVIDEEIAEKDRIANQERLERIAKEKADKEAAEKIAKANQDAIDSENARLALIEKSKQDKIDTENARIKALKDAEAERQNAIKKTQDDEREKVRRQNFEIAQKAKKDKEIADRKAANLNHRKRIHREILEDLLNIGLDEEVGRIVITELSKENPGVRHLQVNY